MRISDWSSDVCSSDLKTDFRGDLPAGWDAELYRNGQLLAFTSPNSDGRYEFIDVPLQYGANRFEIILYGPQRQVRREIKQVQVGMDSIPPQQTWYWAGVAQRMEEHKYELQLIIRILFAVFRLKK